MILPGSYANGFAPRDGQPLYPQLWRGCVGAWAPYLGPTGLSLHDWAAAKNHGTLTNMAVGTTWLPSGGRYCLDFDNTDDYVDCGSSSLFDFTSPFSVSCWFNTNLVSDYQNFATRHSGASGWIFGIYLSRVFLQCGNTYNTTGGTPIVSTWNHVCGTFDGATIRCYLNGAAPDSIASSAPPSLSGSLRIGAYSTTSTAPMNGKLDDVRLYNRALPANAVKLLASRRGIAYELAPRRRSSVQVATFNRRRRLLIGASS